MQLRRIEERRKFDVRANKAVSGFSTLIQRIMF